MGMLLRDNILPGDIAARYGGEEFAIIMTNSTAKQVAEITEKIHCIIKQNQWKISGQYIKVTASIGIASMDADYSSHDLIGKADMALYAAKHQGRDCIVYWDQLEESVFTETMSKIQKVYVNDHIEKFICDTQQAIYSIADAIEADQPCFIHQNAFIIKNSACQIKANKLMDISRRLLFAAQQQEKHLFILLFEELKCEFDRFKNHLTRENSLSAAAAISEKLCFSQN
jgi:hypothetical protein